MGTTYNLRESLDASDNGSLSAVTPCWLRTGGGLRPASRRNRPKIGPERADAAFE